MDKKHCRIFKKFKEGYIKNRSICLEPIVPTNHFLIENEFIFDGKNNLRSSKFLNFYKIQAKLSFVLFSDRDFEFFGRYSYSIIVINKQNRKKIKTCTIKRFETAMLGFEKLIILKIFIKTPYVQQNSLIIGMSHFFIFLFSSEHLLNNYRYNENTIYHHYFSKFWNNFKSK
jgi:hypothetical protein